MYRFRRRLYDIMYFTFHFLEELVASGNNLTTNGQFSARHGSAVMKVTTKAGPGGRPKRTSQSHSSHSIIGRSDEKANQAVVTLRPLTG